MGYAPFRRLPFLPEHFMAVSGQTFEQPVQ
jgi:hypothetical protein